MIVKLVRRLVTLVVLLIVVAVAALFFVDSIAEKGLEQGAGYALGVDVGAGSVDVGLLSGGVSIGALEVANPPGFDASRFIKVKSAAIDLPYATIFDDRVLVPRLLVEDIELFIRRDKDGRANYEAIAERLKRFQGEKKEGGKRFIIKDVLLKRITVNAAVLAGGIAPPPITFTIDEIHLENFGAEDSKGAGIGEVSAGLVEALLRGVQSGGAGILPGDLLKDLKGNLNGLEALEKQGAKLLGGAIPQPSKELLDGVRGILGGERR